MLGEALSVASGGAGAVARSPLFPGHNLSLSVSARRTHLPDLFGGGVLRSFLPKGEGAGSNPFVAYLLGLRYGAIYLLLEAPGMPMSKTPVPLTVKGQPAGSGNEATASICGDLDSSARERHHNGYGIRWG